MRTVAHPRGVARGAELALAFAAPLAGPLAVVACYGVDVPHWDQWEGVGEALVRLRAGTLSLADLTRLHNEHRIFFPRAFFLALASLTRWDVRAEMYATCAALLALGVLAYRLARPLLPEGPSRAWWALAANLALMSTAQFANLLWGFQFHIVVPSALLAGALLAARAVRDPWRRLAAAGAIAFVASFSIGAGLAFWPLLLPLLWTREGEARRTRVRLTAAWAVLAAVTFAMYFHGYAKPAHHPDPISPLSAPLTFATYALAFLGTPFQYLAGPESFRTAVAAGAAVLAAYAGLAAALWRAGRLRAALPVVLLGAYPVGCAMMAAVARGNLGAGQATADRYASAALLLVGSAVYLAAIASTSLPRLRWPARAGAAAAVAALLASAYGTLPLLQNLFLMRHANRAALQFCLVAPNFRQLQKCYERVAELPARAAALDDAGVFSPGLARGFPRVAGPRLGQSLTLAPGQGPPGFLLASGVASRDGAPANAVLLTADDPAAGTPRVVLVIPQMFLGTARSGIAYPVRADDLPPGALRAWAYSFADDAVAELALEDHRGPRPGPPPRTDGPP